MYRVLTMVSTDEGNGIKFPPMTTMSVDVSPGTPKDPTVSNNVITPDSGKWSLRKQAPAQADIEEITAPDLPTENKHAVRLEVSQTDPAKFWAVQILKPVPQAIPAKRDLFVRFWGRSPTNTPVWVVFEQGEPPHRPELQKKISLTPRWKQYEIPFRTTQDHTNPHADFCIKAGIEAGTTEVAGIYVDEVSE